MFYKCNNGYACEHNCPAGLHFNEVLSVCDWPSSACCDPTILCDPPCIPGVTCPPTGPTLAPPTLPPPTLPPPTLPPPTLPPPTLPPPTLPPPTLPPPTLPPPTLPPPTVGPTPSDPCIPGVTCEPNNCHNDMRCPALDGTKPTLFAHAECTKFYKCSNRKACEHSCPTGLHFNAKLFVCDWPSSACCDPTILCDPPCIPGITCSRAFRF
uniref:Chitin-binding type-2 domain-containing protein n=1 Tax=Anopheles maculatus TaxID=74869 RepID=A0A182T7R3_9DIPT